MGEQEDWKQKLNSNLVFLLDKMESDVVLLAYLTQANILTKWKKQELMGIALSWDRNDALLEYIKTRPKEDYYQFLRALTKTGQKYIAEQIEGESALQQILNLECNKPTSPPARNDIDDHDSITVTGGLNSNGFTRDVFRIQQEQSNKCIPLPDLQLKTPRGHHQSVAIREYVITIGGKDETQSLSSAECKNVKLKRSEIIPSMITPRCHFTCAVIGDKIFVAGGWNDRSGELNLCEYYTVSGNTWTNCSPMNCIRCRSSGDVLNGNLYITGGSTYSDSIDKRSVESYNPMVDNWVPQPSLRKGRYDHCCATLDRAIYATGGRGGMQECEFYDPRVDEWRECAGMKQGRRGHALVAFNGKLYAIGGIDAKGAILGSLETYDPAKNEWEITEDVFEPLFAMSAFIS